MLHCADEPRQVAYRNFNLCPHCEQRGEDPLLLRMSECIPMISRSDGKNFHLLLADRPVPFPAERREGPSREFSVCFWYCLGEQKKETKSSLVLVPAESKGHGDLYREIESIADLLVKKLLERKKLAVLYNLQGNSLRELGY